MQVCFYENLKFLINSLNQKLWPVRKININYNNFNKVFSLNLINYMDYDMKGLL